MKKTSMYSDIVASLLDTPKTPAPKQPRPYTKYNAARVAHAVKEKLEKRQHVSIAKIAPLYGYSVSTAEHHAKQITESPSYKAVMEDYAAKLVKERDRQIEAMGRKDLDEEGYKVLSEATARATHDIQLLTGGSTERVSYERERASIALIIASLSGEAPPLQLEEEREEEA